MEKYIKPGIEVVEMQTEDSLLTLVQSVDTPIDDDETDTLTW